MGQKLLTIQQTIEERIEAECVPSYGMYTEKNGAWTTNSIGGFSPSPGCMLYLEQISVTADKPHALQLTTAYNGLIPSGQVNEIVRLNTTSIVLPYRRFCPERESISLSFINSPGGDTETKLYMSATGRVVSNDFFKRGDPIVVISDSIASGTGPTSGVKEYIQLFIKFLDGLSLRKYRKVLKSKGGWASANILNLVLSGRVQQVQSNFGVLLINIGMNDPNLSTYQTNLPQIHSQLRAAYPGWVIWVLGPTPRQDGNEASVLVPIRNYAQTFVSGLSDPLTWYLTLGDAFNPSGDTFYITNDGTSSGTRIHPNDLGHAAMAQKMIDYINSNPDKKYILINGKVPS